MVRPGYKKTDLGVIPESWSAVQLSTLGTFKNGINKSGDAFGYGSPFVNLMDVFGASRIDSSNSLGLLKTSLEEQKTYNLQHGDVIFIRSSVKPSGVGLTVVIESDLPKTVYSGFLIRFRDNNLLDIEFKRHCFYSEKFRGSLIGASSVSANTNINQDNLKKLLIALPPTREEQNAIGAALSDVDAVLDCLDKLIAKKCKLKQAAMQQLLTGRVRLPGFSGAWKVRRLGELAGMGSGGTPLSSIAAYYDGDIPWVSIADMTRGGKVIRKTERNLTSLGYEKSSAQMFSSGTVLYAMYASLGECSIAGDSLCTSQAILGIRPKTGLSSEFLYYHLTSLKSTIKLLGQQGTQSNLNKSMVQNFALNLPGPTEQIAIVEFLSSMDKELDVLERRREKTALLKKGMMQELLTGKTRLI